jgi:hypothetical protein
MKERLADRHWDPLRWLGRRLRGHRDSVAGSGGTP